MLTVDKAVEKYAKAHCRFGVLNVLRNREGEPFLLAW